MAQDLDTETPSLEHFLQKALENRLTELHVALPGKVVNVLEPGKVSVQPLLKRKLKSGQLIDLPVITNVPIKYMRFGSAQLTMPVKPNQTGSLLFIERSMDNWLVAGGSVNPDDQRKHDLSDAVFIPGLYPFNDPPIVIEGKINLTFGTNGRLTIGEDGKVAIGNASGEELLDLVDQIIDEAINTEDGILALTVPTAVGPSGTPINSATFTAIKATLNDIKAKLATIKGTLS